MMIDYLIESNEEIKIPQDEVNFIKDLVKGEVKHTRGQFCLFLLSLSYDLRGKLLAIRPRRVSYSKSSRTNGTESTLTSKRLRMFLLVQ